MNKIFVLVLVAILFSSNKAEGQRTSPEVQASVEAGIDPYFVEFADTISEYGPHSITRYVLQDRNGIFWFATWQGIMSYDGKLFTNHTLKENLIRFHVFYIFEDKTGNLWFATVRGGVYKYDGKSFKLFTTKDGLPDNTVLSMLEDAAGNIWLATPGGVARCASTSTSTTGTAFSKFTTQDGLCCNDVRSITQDLSGKLWFGTEEGISCYDGKTFTNLLNKEGLPFEKVGCLFRDKAGNIWIGSGKGLCRYDGTRTGHACNKNTCKHNPRVQQDLKAHNEELAKSLSGFIIPNFVMYMFQDKKGNIWLSFNETLNHNFVLHTYDGNTFTKILEQNGDNPVIFGITQDRDGNIWFGTLKGVCRLDILRTQNPCLSKTCHHDLPIREAIQEHNQELARSYTYFKE